MTILEFWIHSPLAKALGAALAHFVWEGAAIAAILAVALAFSRKCNIRYAMACTGLIAMPLCFAITLVLSMPRSQVTAGVGVTPSRVPSVAILFDFPPTDASRTSANPLAWAVPLWMAGAVSLLLYRIASWIVAQRLSRRGTCPAPCEWTWRVAALAEPLGMSRPVRLLESCLAEVPLTLGYLRPVILVPIGMLAGLPCDQIEAILLHELAHIRRADYLVNLLQTTIESLLFYHPAVWWISSVLRAERENCCDDLVLARKIDPRTYASALLAIERGRQTEPALAASGGDLLRRVRRVLRTSPVQDSSVAIGPIALAILGAGLAVAAFQSKPVKPAGFVALPQMQIPNANPAAQPRMLAQAQPPQQRNQNPPSAPKSTPYEKWINEDAAYIITAGERAQWDRLTGDPEREKFIEDFWLRRDPTPGTAANEFREEHYRRIAYSNERFGVKDGLPGWKTDRGRFYISYGPPDEIESHPKGGGTAGDAPFEKWRYRHIEGIGDNVEVEFVAAAQDGEYLLTGPPHRHAQEDMEQILKQLVKLLNESNGSDAEYRSTLNQLEGLLKQRDEPKPLESPAQQSLRLEMEIRRQQEILKELRKRFSDAYPDVQTVLERIEQLRHEERELLNQVNEAKPPESPAQELLRLDGQRRQLEELLRQLRARFSDAYPDVQTTIGRLAQVRKRELELLSLREN